MILTCNSAVASLMVSGFFNNISVISWWSVILVEESGENHRPVASHRSTLSHDVGSRTPLHDRDSISDDRY